MPRKTTTTIDTDQPAMPAAAPAEAAPKRKPARRSTAKAADAANVETVTAEAEAPKKRTRKPAKPVEAAAPADTATPAPAAPAAAPAVANDVAPATLEPTAEPDLLEEVRTEAYLIWLGCGQPDGRQDEHWAMAESIVRARRTPSAAPQAAE